MNTMGIPVLEGSFGSEDADRDRLGALMGSTDRDTTQNRIVARGRKSRTSQAGMGREVQFCPFDSVQSPYNSCRFYHRYGGATARNATGSPYQYHNGLEPVYGYDSTRQMYRYSHMHDGSDGTARNGHAFLSKTFAHDLNRKYGAGYTPQNGDSLGVVQLGTGAE